MDLVVDVVDALSERLQHLQCDCQRQPAEAMEMAITDFWNVLTLQQAGGAPPVQPASTLPRLSGEQGVQPHALPEAAALAAVDILMAAQAAIMLETQEQQSLYVDMLNDLREGVNDAQAAVQAEARSHMGHECEHALHHGQQSLPWARLSRPAATAVLAHLKLARRRHLQVQRTVFTTRERSTRARNVMRLLRKIRSIIICKRKPKPRHARGSAMGRRRSPGPPSSSPNASDSDNDGAHSRVTWGNDLHAWG